MTHDIPARKPGERFLQIASLVIALVAIVVTVVLSVRSEGVKDITITYDPQRPLVSMEGRPNADLEVRLGDVKVEAPWLVTGRLQNSGNQPIEERDIEDPIKLSFTRGRIIAAEVVQSSQRALSAKASAVGNQVTLTHKLLNPGDWVSFDIVFDGEPNMLPELTSRISGVSRPNQIMAVSGKARTTPSLVPLPDPFVYLFLSFCSFVALVIFGLGIALISAEFKKFFAASRPGTPRIPGAGPYEASFLPPDYISKQLAPQGRAARTVFAALGEHVDAKWLDDPAHLKSQISENVPEALLQSLNLDLDGATSLLATELKLTLRNRIGSALFAHLPVGLDQLAKDVILAMDVTKASTTDLFNRARELAAEAGAHVRAKPRIDRDDLLFGFLCLAAGTSLVLILGGTWRTLLPF